MTPRLVILSRISVILSRIFVILTPRLVILSRVSVILSRSEESIQPQAWKGGQP